MIRKSLILMAGAALALTGCQSHVLPAYETSRDTLFHLQQLRVEPVAVGAFTGGPASLGDSTRWDSSLGCRLERTRGDGAIAYQDYARQAFVNEIAAAGLYSAEPADVTIGGYIDQVGFEPVLSPFDKTWTLGLVLISTNGRQLRVENRHKFDSGALAGPTICARAIDAFGPAVQELIAKAVASPEFPALLD